jgi:hypothetical protein
MTNDRKGGIAFIVGSVGFIVTMAVHPTPGGQLQAEQVVRLSQTSGLAHSLGIASAIFLFLGACALAQRLRDQTCSFAALVTFGFSCVAIVIAASISGFVMPALLKRMAHDDAANAHLWQIVIWGIFQINQALARVYAILASVAIVLWSTAAWRNRGLHRGIVIYGYVIAALIIVAVASGHMRMDVHGMAAVGLGQAIWFVLAGVQMGSRQVVPTQIVK